MPEEKADSSPSSLFRFSPTIELGHLIQALVMVGMLGGWALVGYQTIDRQLAQHSAEMELFKQRQGMLEATISELKTNLQTSNNETRTTLNKISDALGELKASVAGQGGRLDARH